MLAMLATKGFANQAFAQGSVIIGLTTLQQVWLVEFKQGARAVMFKEGKGHTREQLGAKAHWEGQACATDTLQGTTWSWVVLQICAACAS